MRTRFSKVLPDMYTYDVSEDSYQILPDRNTYEDSEDSCEEADCYAGQSESYDDNKELHRSKCWKRRKYGIFWDQNDLESRRYEIEGELEAITE